MTAQEWKDIMAAWESVITIIAIIVGGGWAIARFWREREGAPRIQFDVRMKVLGNTGAQLLLEVLAVLENTGKIRHRIERLTFSLSYLVTGDPIAHAGQTSAVPFPHNGGTGSWLGDKWLYTFVEPGVRQSYTVVWTIPSAAVYVHLSGRFDYPGGNEIHDAEWVTSIRREATA
jgi:hypothetical protein